MAVLSKPLIESGKKEFFLKIEGMNNSRKLTIGFAHINIDREKNCGSGKRYVLNKEKRHNIFQVSATGEVI